MTGLRTDLGSRNEASCCIEDGTKAHRTHAAGQLEGYCKHSGKKDFRMEAWDWMGSGSNLHACSTGFADGLDAECEREKS